MKILDDHFISFEQFYLSYNFFQHLVQALNAAVISNLYPRCQIDVYVEIIQSDGSDFCACLNVATLALIDAGMYHIQSNITNYKSFLYFQEYLSRI